MYKDKVLESPMLVDTGSDFCLISENKLPDSMKLELLPCDLTITGVGSINKPSGKLVCNVVLNECTVENIDFLAIKTNIPTIIGNNVLRHNSVSQHSVSQTEFSINFKNGKVCTMPLLEPYVQSATFVAQIPVTDTLTEKLRWLKTKYEVNISYTDDDKLHQFVDLLIENRNIFGDDNTMGKFPEMVRLKTQGNPISVRQHPIAKQYEDKVDLELSKMLKLDVIEKIDDCQGWCTPLLVVGKKDGNCRVVANFKPTLNKRLVAPEPFNVPSCDEIFSSIRPGNRYFSSMDLQKGYWQLQIEPSDRVKTSFQWKGQFYQYKRLPMGFHCSGNLFAKAVNTALSSVSFDISKVLTYLDDICIVDNDWDSFILSHKKVLKHYRNLT